MQCSKLPTATLMSTALLRVPKRVTTMALPLATAKMKHLQPASLSSFMSITSVLIPIS